MAMEILLAPFTFIISFVKHFFIGHIKIQLCNYPFKNGTALDQLRVVLGQLGTCLHISTGKRIIVLFIQHHDLRGRFILGSDKKHGSNNGKDSQKNTGKNNHAQLADYQVKDFT